MTMTTWITDGICAVAFAASFAERHRCSDCGDEGVAFGLRHLNRQILRHERLHQAMTEILEMLRAGRLNADDIRAGVTEPALADTARLRLQRQGLIRQEWAAQSGFRPALPVYRRTGTKVEVA